MPAYEQLLKLGREREGALFLDIGCCCACFRFTGACRLFDELPSQSVMTSARL